MIEGFVRGDFQGFDCDKKKALVVFFLYTADHVIKKASQA